VTLNFSVFTKKLDIFNYSFLNRFSIFSSIVAEHRTNLSFLSVFSDFFLKYMVSNSKRRSILADL